MTSGPTTPNFDADSVRAREVGAVVLLLLLSFVARFAFAEYVLRHVPEKLPDTALYVNYARTIFDQTPYEVSGAYALRTPGYPLFLAACWKLAGEQSTRAVLWGQAFLGTMTGLVIYLIARHFECRGAPVGMGFIALLLTLIEPYSILLGGLELSETLFAFLLSLTALLLVKTQGTFARAGALGTGLIFGLGVLTRPSVLLLAPFVAIFCGGGAPSRSGSLQLVLLSFLGMALVLSPWWIRNARHFDHFVPTTSNVGESLYDGLNPQATGASNMDFKQSPEVARMSEREQDDYWRQQAFTWASRHPMDVLRLAVVKLARYWSPWPNEARFRTIPLLIATTLITLVIYVGAVMGAVRQARGPAGSWSLSLIAAGPVIYFCLLHLIFVSSVRYRAVAMPLLTLLAARGWARTRT